MSGPGGGLSPFYSGALDKPVASGFTGVYGTNVTAQTLSDLASGRGINFKMKATSSHTWTTALLKDNATLPAGDFTMTAWFVPGMIQAFSGSSRDPHYGFYLRDTSNTISTFGIGQTNFYTEHFGTINGSGTPTTLMAYPNSTPLWMRLVFHSSTNTVDLYMSRDGETFVTVAVGVATSIGTLQDIGIGCGIYTSIVAQEYNLSVMSYKVT